MARRDVLLVVVVQRRGTDMLVQCALDVPRPALELGLLGREVDIS